MGIEFIFKNETVYSKEHCDLSTIALQMTPINVSRCVATTTSIQWIAFSLTIPLQSYFFLVFLGFSASSPVSCFRFFSFSFSFSFSVCLEGADSSPILALAFLSFLSGLSALVQYFLAFLPAVCARWCHLNSDQVDLPKKRSRCALPNEVSPIYCVYIASCGGQPIQPLPCIHTLQLEISGGPHFHLGSNSLAAPGPWIAEENGGKVFEWDARLYTTILLTWGFWAMIPLLSWSSIYVIFESLRPKLESSFSHPIFSHTVEPGPLVRIELIVQECNSLEYTSMPACVVSVCKIDNSVCWVENLSPVNRSASPRAHASLQRSYCESTSLMCFSKSCTHLRWGRMDRI